MFFFEWKEEMLLYPLVKQVISRMATLGVWVSILLALAAASALLGAVWSLWSDDLIAYLLVVGGSMVAGLSAEIVLALWILLGLWCHHVLLAGRGLALTRWGMLLLPFFACLNPVCELYLLFTGEPLLVNQAVLMPVLVSLACVVIWVNWPATEAASHRLRFCLAVQPALLAVGYLTGGELSPLLLVSFLSYGAAGVLSACLLRQMARVAPLIVSLPPLPVPVSPQDPPSVQ